jgi:hypothetical protein
MDIAGYNEAFDEAGALRGPYRAFRARTGRNPFDPTPESVAALSQRPLGDRYTILPIPLVLDDSEYRETIVRGVRQRALALQQLFWDVVRSRETPLPANLLSRIVEREGMSVRDLTRWWNGKHRRDVRFTCAPDLVRGQDGRWCILEDNVGCVGGVVDSWFVLERFLLHTGAPLDPSLPAGADLTRAVREFLADVGQTPASADVLALLGPQCSTDLEARRKREVLEAMGLRVLDKEEVEAATRKGLSSAGLRGLVNFDSRGWTSTAELTDELFVRRGVPLMTAPGTEFLGNKALLPLMDEIVSFYSGEKPILRTVETELCRRLPDDPTGWVLKKSNGCGGREVYFLDGASGAEMHRLEMMLAGWGGSDSAVLQRRVRASFLPISPAVPWHRFQVELRPVGFVIGDLTCIVSEHPSGRALSNLDGHGLGNMSQGAHYLPVIREPGC